MEPPATATGNPQPDQPPPPPARRRVGGAGAGALAPPLGTRTGLNEPATITGREGPPTTPSFSGRTQPRLPLLADAGLGDQVASFADAEPGVEQVPDDEPLGW